jgi:hypothetical protein
VERNKKNEEEKEEEEEEEKKEEKKKRKKRQLCFRSQTQIRAKLLKLPPTILGW